MKKLIEKGIGIMLWCLQMVMLGVAAYGIYLFICGYIIDVGEGYSQWGIFKGHPSMYFLPDMSTCEKVQFYIGEIFSAIGGILAGGILGILFFLLVKMIFITEYEAHNTRRQFKNSGKNWWYGYSIDKATELVKEDWSRICKPFHLCNLSFSMIDSMSGKDMSYRFSGLGGLENMLISCGLSLSLIRKSNEDIEQDRDSARDEMSTYIANKEEAESKYLAARIKSEDKMISERGISPLGVFAKECIYYFCIPSVSLSFFVSDIFFFFVNHWFTLMVTSLVFFFPSAGEYIMEKLFTGEERVGGSLFDFFCWTTPVLCFITFRLLYWWNVKKDKIRLQIRTIETDNCFDEPCPTNYKKSAIKFVDFALPRYAVVFGAAMCPSYHILDIFQAFLDLHKDGWRMKIFPFSRERIHEEKQLAHERGEEIVIFPDVDEIDARLAEEERREQMIASIGDV